MKTLIHLIWIKQIYAKTFSLFCVYDNWIITSDNFFFFFFFLEISFFNNSYSVVNTQNRGEGFLHKFVLFKLNVSKFSPKFKSSFIN